MTKYAQFISGVIGGVITGVVFGALGCVFAPYLGFNNMFGAEEFACSMSAGFYIMILLPIGIFAAIWLISKLKKYSFNALYPLWLVAVLFIVGILMRNLMNLYSFLVIVLLYSALLTFAGTFTLKQKANVNSSL